MMLAEDHIDHLLGHGWKDRHHQRPNNRAEHRGRRHPRIASGVTKDPE